MEWSEVQRIRFDFCVDEEEFVPKAEAEAKIESLLKTVHDLETELDFAIRVLVTEQSELRPEQLSYLMSARAQVNKEEENNDTYPEQQD